MAGGVDRGNALELEVPGEIGIGERCDERTRRAVDVHRDVEARALLQVVESGADLGHGLVRAVERRAEDRHHADRVLVAELHRLLGGEMEAVALHRHEPHLDVPVVRELLPADLHVDPHHEVRLVGGFALRLATVLPQPLESEAAEHCRLARPRGRAAHGLAGLRRVPEAAEDVDTAHLELGGLRILVLVDHVLVEALGHQPLRLRLHPRAHERGEVHAGVPVEHQLVVDDLVGDLGRKLGLAQRVPWDVVALEGEDRREIGCRACCCLRVFQCHRDLPPVS